jgi:AraC-like DNA-binding protein
MIKTIIYDLSNIIYLAQEGKQIVSKNRAEHIFGDFIEIVSHNYMKERTVSWYAEQMDITPKYLAEMVKQATNRSPNDWIDGYVIVEIRMLLKYTGKSIKEIAEIMHFTSQSFLGKYFKEHVGVSPKDYRKS